MVSDGDRDGVAVGDVVEDGEGDMRYRKMKCGVCGGRMVLERHQGNIHQ